MATVNRKVFDKNKIQTDISVFPDWCLTKERKVKKSHKSKYEGPFWSKQGIYHILFSVKINFVYKIFYTSSTGYVAQELILVYFFSLRIKFL